MLSLLGSLLVGLVVGLLARAVKPGDDSMGWLMTIVLGIAGSLIAGYAGRAMGWYQPGEPAGWIASVVGAVVLLLIYGMIRKKSA
ncbi:GlsB/YeaQ/YmgE family stress response membrane protein [Pigmentiphaga kullae]|uniref:Putative membrane protein YeaQ/YmgE (Transglycosylase-associated protein family) n=1 Tax=Pigmentiphaga kullae TaxID=151784 RepID=A0A4Q7NEW7_9BURK|nr:GlsB/YeaQ/YmgE family stress response membrane protein [Pigmentiphaga kullae]RZS81565.1 putative membrane protein YeaQ/YmgE (transglycosylase-associated protein family) [Pigmentiphaga kullae]